MSMYATIEFYKSYERDSMTMDQEIEQISDATWNTMPTTSRFFKKELDFDALEKQYKKKFDSGVNQYYKNIGFDGPHSDPSLTIGFDGAGLFEVLTPLEESRIKNREYYYYPVSEVQNKMNAIWKEFDYIESNNPENWDKNYISDLKNTLRKLERNLKTPGIRTVGIKYSY